MSLEPAFVCTKCGICCQRLKGIEECEHMDRGDGVCKYYDEVKKECKIYDFRPDICNVEKHYKKYKNKYTWEEYLKMNYDACKAMQEEENKKS